MRLGDVGAHDLVVGPQRLGNVVVVPRQLARQYVRPHHSERTTHARGGRRDVPGVADEGDATLDYVLQLDLRHGE